MTTLQLKALCEAVRLATEVSYQLMERGLPKEELSMPASKGMDTLQKLHRAIDWLENLRADARAAK